MKRLILAAVAAIFMAASPASAADVTSGFWFHSTTGNWSTYVNMQNRDTVGQTLTAKFYKLDGTLMATTSQSIAANGTWFFSTSTVGNTNATVFNGDVRGAVILSAANAKTTAQGSVIEFALSSESGFSFSNVY